MVIRNVTAPPHTCIVYLTPPRLFFFFAPAADNNIAWWYYQVALSIALHAGDNFRANLLAQQLPNLVSKQISSDGVLLNEVKYAETNRLPVLLCIGPIQTPVHGSLWLHRGAGTGRIFVWFFVELQANEDVQECCLSSARQDMPINPLSFFYACTIRRRPASRQYVAYALTAIARCAVYGAKTPATNLFTNPAVRAAFTWPTKYIGGYVGLPLPWELNL
jgi:hypothetical protein